MITFNHLKLQKISQSRATILDLSQRRASDNQSERYASLRKQDHHQNAKDGGVEPRERHHRHDTI